MFWKNNMRSWRLKVHIIKIFNKFVIIGNYIYYCLIKFLKFEKMKYLAVK